MKQLPLSNSPYAPKFSWLRGTAFRMFVVLTLALLPLALVALFSTLRSMNSAQNNALQLLRTTTEQIAGKLDSNVTGVQTAQNLVVNAFDANTTFKEICDRMGMFVHGGRKPADIIFTVVGRDGHVICPASDPKKLPTNMLVSLHEGSDVTLDTVSRGILIRTASRDNSLIAGTLYPEGFLRHLAFPEENDQARRISLRQGNRYLAVNSAANTFRRSNLSTAWAPVGSTGISLMLALEDQPRTLAQSLALAAPLFMWIAAAVLGWLVVRWLLIQPLVALRQIVSTYQPGQIATPPRKLLNASHEISELGQTFEAMSAQVAAHEGEMRNALDRQTKLTREVHHRVKNNLQIISSLISLHARATNDTRARDAYAAILRRVDALAVVQRNHYAELEENRGVSAPPLITEIAASLRASVPADRAPLSIHVDCDPVYLHQDVAAPSAFLIAELADLAMRIDPSSALKISLIRTPDDSTKAMLRVQSTTFQANVLGLHDTVRLFERILTGLSRQLRAPLDYDPDTGEYCIRLSII